MMEIKHTLSMLGKSINNNKTRAMYLYQRQNRLRSEIHELKLEISQNDFYPDYDGYSLEMEIELKSLINEYLKNKLEIWKLEERQKADKRKFKELNRQYQKEQVK